MPVCYPGPKDTIGLGTCRAGTLICNEGKSGSNFKTDHAHCGQRGKACGEDPYCHA